MSPPERPNPRAARRPGPVVLDLAPFGGHARQRRKRAPKPPITIERILNTAFAVMARDGYEAVTMRRLAQELGTGPASLYAHIDSKRELDAMIVDRVVAEIELPEADPGRWQEQVMQLARGLRAAMLRHPGVARAVIGTVPTGSQAMVTSEWLMSLLLEAGVAEQVAAWACDLLPLYVTAVAFEESVQFAKPGAAVSQQQEDFGAELRAYFESLPADQFPHLVGSAIALTSGGGDERFEFGLRVLVAGLQAVSDAWPGDAAKPGASAGPTVVR